MRLFPRHILRVVLVLLVCATPLLWLWDAPSLYRTATPSIRITDADGTLLRVHRPDGWHLRLEPPAVPGHIADDLVAIEDQRFHAHPGVDLLAVVRAARDNLQAGRIVSGASTLSMQVARLQAPEAKRTWLTKLREAAQALRLELHYDKVDLLTAWLNLASFGPQITGLAAASQVYFGKDIAELHRAQSTFLLGLPQSPSRYDPYRFAVQARRRHQRVLDQLVAQNRLSPSDARALATVPLDLHPPDRHYKAPQAVQEALASAPAGGIQEIRTTLDLSLQEAIEGRVRSHLQRLHSAATTQAAVLVLDNQTGAVRAYVGSADFWNAKAGGQNDGIRMLRQPGSALKPFLYAQALQEGTHTPASILDDLEVHIPGASGAFAPENYDRKEHGPTPLRVALASSFNLPAVRLTRERTPTRVLEGFHAAGLTDLRLPPDTYGLGLALGNGEVSLWTLASAYTGLARGGTYVRPHLIQWTRNVAGDTLRTPPVVPRPSGFDVATAYLIHDMLSDADARAPGFGHHSPLHLPFPLAVKTGTTKDYRDNWAIGYTAAYTIGVWVGNFDGTPMQRVSGVTGAAPILRDVALLLGPAQRLSMPETLTLEAYCPDSGLRLGRWCPVPARGPFRTGTTPHDTCTVHQLVVLDNRSGQRARSDTRAAFHDSVVYTVHPSRFHAWMTAQGLSLPPPTSSPFRVAEEQPALSITYPTDGASFILDPLLPPAYQRIHLEATLPLEAEAITWWVNKQPLKGAAPSPTWPLKTGTHTFNVQATVAGRTWDSAPVTITVGSVPPLTSD